MSYAAQAYARTAQKVATPRDIEAQALLKAARKLQASVGWKTVSDPVTGAKLGLIKYYHFGEGTVAGVDGAPAPSGTVLLQGEDGTARTVEIGANGRYRFGGLGQS